MADQDLATQSSQVLASDADAKALSPEYELNDIIRHLLQSIQQHMDPTLEKFVDRMDTIEANNRAKFESIEEKLNVLCELMKSNPPANNNIHPTNPRKRVATDDADGSSAPPAKRHKPSKQARTLVGLVNSPAFNKYFGPMLPTDETTKQKKIAMYFEPEQGLYKNHPVENKDIKLVFHLIYHPTTQCLMINNIGWKDVSNGTDGKIQWLYVILNDGPENYDESVVQTEIDKIVRYLKPYHLRLAAEYQKVVDDFTNSQKEPPKTLSNNLDLFQTCMKELGVKDDDSAEARMVKIIEGLRNVTYPSIYSVIVHSSLPTKTQTVNPLFLLFQPSTAIGANDMHFRKTFTLHTLKKTIQIDPFWAASDAILVPLRLPAQPSMYWVEKVIQACDRLSSHRLSNTNRKKVLDEVVKLINGLGVKESENNNNHKPLSPIRAPATVTRVGAGKSPVKSKEKRSSKDKKRRQPSSESSSESSESDSD